MQSGDPQGRATLAASQTLTVTAEDRRSAVAIFELWQSQWPGRVRGEAWLHMERLKKAISESLAGER